MIKIQWIFHVLFRNDAEDLLPKLACNSSCISNLNLELEEYYSILKSSFNQFKFNLKIQDYKKKLFMFWQRFRS